MILYKSKTMDNIYNLIKEKPMCRNDLVNYLNLSRTTIYDNLEKLEKSGLIDKFRFINGKKGRPIIFWKIKELEIKDMDFYNVIFKDKEVKDLYSNNIIFNTSNKRSKHNNFRNISFGLSNNKLKLKPIYIKNEKRKRRLSKNFEHIDKKGICFKCQKSINSNRDMLRLKDNHWYCLECIANNKILFNLLTPNGYWYNYIKLQTNLTKGKKRKSYVL